MDNRKGIYETGSKMIIIIKMSEINELDLAECLSEDFSPEDLQALIEE